jgi:hypothetical protein
MSTSLLKRTGKLTSTRRAPSGGGVTVATTSLAVCCMNGGRARDPPQPAISNANHIGSARPRIETQRL